jgi:TonB family protein
VGTALLYPLQARPATIAFDGAPRDGAFHAVVRSTSCATPNVRASLVDASFEVPEIVKQQRVVGQTLVLVALHDSSRLKTATLYQSSGNHWLDEAALRTAKLARYSAEVVDCTKVAGTYLLVVRTGEEDL